MIESGPGELVRDLFPPTVAQKIQDSFKAGIESKASGKGAITEFCERIDIQYEPVSELNNSSSVSSSILRFILEVERRYLTCDDVSTGILLVLLGCKVELDRCLFQGHWYH